MTLNQRSAKLTLRNATLEDVDAILGLQARAYPTMTPDPPSMIRGQISAFPEGQFIVEFDGEVVGWCASFIIDEAAAFAPMTGRASPGAASPRATILTASGSMAWRWR